MVNSKVIHIATPGQGLYEITTEIQAIVSESGTKDGLCNIFIQHTSASLTVQENADPSAKRDLEKWLNRLVRENDELYTHTAEGADDMPAHIKSILTCVNLSIPICGGLIALGTWQGIYLWEHRRSKHRRKLLITIIS